MHLQKVGMVIVHLPPLRVMCVIDPVAKMHKQIIGMPSTNGFDFSNGYECITKLEHLMYVKLSERLNIYLQVVLFA